MYIINLIISIWASLVAQMVKNMLEIQETWVPSLGWEDPLKEGMGTDSSILNWRIPMDRGAWWAIVNRITKSRHDWVMTYMFVSPNQEPGFVSVSYRCNRESRIKCMAQKGPSGNIWTPNWNQSKHGIMPRVKRKGVQDLNIGSDSYYIKVVTYDM